MEVQSKIIGNKVLCVLEEYFFKVVRMVLLLILSFTVYYIISDMVGGQLSENIDPVRGMLFGGKKIVLASMIIILAAIYLINFIFTKISEWNRMLEIIVLCFYFMLCLLFSYYFANKGMFEIGVINDVSNAIACGGECDYSTLDFMSRYSYLRSLACFASIFSLAGEKVKSIYLCLGMVMGLFSSLEFLKMIKCTPKALFMTSVFFYVSMPLYLSCSVFYNYTLVFWIPITIITLYCKIRAGNYNILLAVLLVVISTLGICLFSIVWVPVIAIVIDMFFCKNRKMFISVITIIISVTLLNSISYKLVDEKIYNTPELRNLCEQNEIPMFASTLYTGLNDDSVGFYTNDDVIQILAISSYDEKKEFLKEESINRIIGKRGHLLDFVLKKSSLTFGHGTFNTEAVSNDGLLKERRLIKYFSKDYEEVRYFRGFYCAFNILLLILIVLQIMARRSKDNNIIYLVILGFWMVSMISETDSRHMMPCLPFLFVLAVQTIVDIAEGKIILLSSNDMEK